MKALEHIRNRLINNYVCDYPVDLEHRQKFVDYVSQLIDEDYLPLPGVFAYNDPKYGHVISAEWVVGKDSFDIEIDFDDSKPKYGMMFIALSKTKDHRVYEICDINNQRLILDQYKESNESN